MPNEKQVIIVYVASLSQGMLWKVHFEFAYGHIKTHPYFPCKNKDGFFCHNPNFGLATKARACKGEGQERNPGVTFHAPGSIGECEGMNPHTPKWAPTLGIWVSMDYQTFRERL